MFVCMRVTMLGGRGQCALSGVLRGHFLGIKMLQCNIKSLAGPIVVEQLLES